MFPLQSAAYILYGTPSAEYLNIFPEQVHRLVPPAYALPPVEGNVLYVATDLFHATMPPDAFFAALAPSRVLLLPAVPCRETLRRLLNVVRARQGEPPLETTVSDDNLAASMRGYVGIASGANAPPLPRIVTPELDLLDPYPPLSGERLIVDGAPRIFRPSVSPVNADFEVEAPPTEPGSLVYHLSRLPTGACVALRAAFGGPGARESRDLFLYRRHENDLLHALRLIHQNGLVQFSVDHLPDPYLSRSSHLFGDDRTTWLTDLFRTKPVLSVREVSRFADVFGITQTPFDGAAATDYYGTEGVVFSCPGLFIFLPNL